MTVVALTERNPRSGSLVTDRRRDRVLWTIGFVLLCTAPLAFVTALLRRFLAEVFRDDTFAYIPLIPAVTCFLIHSERNLIFSAASHGWRSGSASLVPGAACLFLARANALQLRPENQISLLIFGLILIWAGAFALCFGGSSLRAALFPFLFLLFMIPVPEPILSQAVALLQHGSARAAQWIFGLIGVPFLRQGLDFMLPGITIRVAEECSGIRSTLALLITTVLASHFILRSAWTRLFLCIVVVPITILKNGLRIVTLSTLAVYVNPGFLNGNLHHRGGIVFFVLALLPMAGFLILLQKAETRRFGGMKNAGARAACGSAR